MSDYITGELVHVGTYSEAEQPFGETSLACAVVCMDREQLKVARALPMHDRVAIIRTAELEQLERENAKLRSNFMAAESEIIFLREERDGLRAENAALRETLHDIMTESDEQVIWRMARAALEKEARL